MKQYIVDTFTNKPFAGNPAAVCVMDSWPSEGSMMKLAMENNLSETAFIVKEEKGYHLRWFTPGTEVELCGHATLASAYVILNFYESDKREVMFNTMSGELIVKQKENLYEMDFPTYELKEVPVTDDMEKAFGARPIKAVLGLDLICVFESEETVRKLDPDQELLSGLEGSDTKCDSTGCRYRLCITQFLSETRVLQKTLFADPRIARSQHTGRMNSVRKKSWLIRLRNAEDICIARLQESVAGSGSAEKRH